jgi:hypothetical protein
MKRVRRAGEGAEQRRAGRSGVEAAFGGAGWTRRREERGGGTVGSGPEPAGRR